MTLLLAQLLLAGAWAGEDPVPRAAAVLEQRLERLRADPDGVGFAVCLADVEGVKLLETGGVRRLGESSPVVPETRFRIASLSKGFASSVTAQLVAEGRLQWDEPVASSVPYFTLHDPAEASRTGLEHLLSHRVGLPHNAYDKLLEAGWSVEKIVKRYERVEPLCQVGTCYGYQNISYNLVSDVIESRLGVDYESEVERRIFRPLGMEHSSFGDRGLLDSPDWAAPHIGRGSRARPVGLKPHYYRLPASAGINASIQDMCRWLRAQLGQAPGVLSEELRETLWTPRVETRRELYRGRWRRARLKEAHYGLGWRIYDYQGERVIYHAGSVQGYGAQLAVVPRLGVGLVALWNSQSSRPWGLTGEFLDALLGLPHEDWMKLDELATVAAVPSAASAAGR